jgi:hypothetical protein
LPERIVADRWTTEGAKFVKGDRPLDAAATGRRWLMQPAVAEIVASTLLEGAEHGDY